ncbi:actin, clone 302-like [Neocloeon triangulifer]|uniref:actin, clone 302-like n=1 Tax=Neocloeon triangulifer TaxID=2078957 RepID=UPI00286F7BC7|nr:actin, clone 302-like [Neocloeon triangulifer]
MERHSSIVMELGAETCKVGLSNQRTPASIRTIVGRPINKGGISILRDHYVGDEALLKQDVLGLRRPLRRGRVDSWDDMILLWQYAFKEVLRVDPEQHPVLLSEQPLVPPVNREKMTQVLFENFNVPKMYVASQPALTLFSIGKTNGLILDTGLDATYAVPIYDGFTVKEGIRRVDLGGNDITNYMQRELEARGVFTQHADVLVHNLCYVATDLEAELKNPNLSASFQLPDGQVVNVDSERVLAPEGLFNTAVFGCEAMGVPQLVSEAIQDCPSAIQQTISKQVVISGGPRTLPYLADRLHTELEARLGGHLKIGVWGHENGLVPSAWMGGAIFAELKQFQDMWITKKEYDELGPNVVHRKCDLV